MPSRPNQYKAWVRAQKTARKILIDEDYQGALLERSLRKTCQNEKALSQVKDEFRSLQHLVQKSRNGGVSALPKKKLVIALASILYFVNPMDLIPDFAVGIGFVDDVAIILMAIGVLRKHLEKKPAPARPLAKETKKSNRRVNAA